MSNEFLLTKSACLCQKAHLLAAEESRRKTEMGSFFPPNDFFYCQEVISVVNLFLKGTGRSHRELIYYFRDFFN